MLLIVVIDEILCMSYDVIVVIVMGCMLVDIVLRVYVVNISVVCC